MKDRDAFDFDADYGVEYDWIAQTVIPAYDQIFAAGAALLGSRGPVASLLVVGCGTGREIETFSSVFPDLMLTGVDPSREMIAACDRIRTRDGLQGRLQLVHGTASSLPAEPSFDAATIYNVMHFLDDAGAKRDLLASVSDRVRADGHVVLFDLHGDPGSEAFTANRDAWYAFFAARGLTGDAARRFIERLDRGIVYVPEERILDLAASVGLVPVARWFTGFLYGGWLLIRSW